MVYTKKCSICGEQFEAKRKDAKFCSTACRIKSSKSKNQELMGNSNEEIKEPMQLERSLALSGNMDEDLFRFKITEIQKTISVITDHIKVCFTERERYQKLKDEDLDNRSDHLAEIRNIEDDISDLESVLQLDDLHLFNKHLNKGSRIDLITDKADAVIRVYRSKLEKSISEYKRKVELCEKAVVDINNCLSEFDATIEKYDIFINSNTDRLLKLEEMAFGSYTDNRA